jgi:hypothetical protein
VNIKRKSMKEKKEKRTSQVHIKEKEEYKEKSEDKKERKKER